MEPGPTAGDDGHAGFGQFPAHFHSHLVIRGAGLGPGRAENADGFANARQGAEAFNKLTLDPQHAPRIGMHKLAGAGGIQQVLVGHIHVCLFTAKFKGAFTARLGILGRICVDAHIPRLTSGGRYLLNHDRRELGVIRIIRPGCSLDSFL